jgi:hypothetical protein
MNAARTAATETVTPAAEKPAHPFACFGPGPYRLLGVETTEDREMLNADLKGKGLPYTENMCGGTCDYCGQAIWDVWRFRCSNGDTFKVGCDCALKAFEHAPKAMKVIEAEARKVETRKRHVREERTLAEAKAWIEANAAALSALPHPAEFRAARGETMLDSLTWHMDHAGTAGKIKAYKAAKKALQTN